MTVFDDSPTKIPDQGPADKYDVFISYSTIDRARVNGLRLLVEGMGHKAFQDHVSIRPGKRWKAAIDAGIENAGALLVFWTKNSAASDPVRKEIEWFHANRPGQPLIPILGDETPVVGVLSEHQWANLWGEGTAPAAAEDAAATVLEAGAGGPGAPAAPGTEPAAAAAAAPSEGPFAVLNEVLVMKRELEAQGVPPEEIHKRALARLEAEGIDLKPQQKRKLIFLFLGFGLLQLLRRYAGEGVRQIGRTFTGKVWPYAGPIAATAALTAALVAGYGWAADRAGWFPFDRPHGERPPIVFGVPDSVLVERLESANRSWETTRRTVDSLVRLTEVVRDDPPAGVSTAEIEAMLRAGLLVLREDLSRTQRMILDIHARLDELAWEPLPEGERRADSGLDSLLLVGLGRTRDGVDAVYASLAVLRERLTERPPVLEGIDLTEIENELRLGFDETQRMIEGLNFNLASLDRLRRLGSVGESGGETITLGDVETVVYNQLRGPRETLNLIYEELSGMAGPGGAPPGGGVPPARDRDAELFALLISQGETMEEILQILQLHVSPVAGAGPGGAAAPGGGAGGGGAVGAPGATVRTVRIFLPFGSGPFVEPEPDCALGPGAPSCPTAPPAYPVAAADGDIDGEVTVVAVIAEDGSVEIMSVHAGSGSEVLLEPAEEIVSEWRFRPGTLNGRPARARMFVTLAFVR